MIVAACTNEASCALCFIHNDSSETNDTTVCTQVLCTDRLCCKNSATNLLGKGMGERGAGLKLHRAIKYIISTLL